MGAAPCGFQGAGFLLGFVGWPTLCEFVSCKGWVFGLHSPIIPFPTTPPATNPLCASPAASSYPESPACSPAHPQPCAPTDEPQLPYPTSSSACASSQLFFPVI